MTLSDKRELGMCKLVEHKRHGCYWIKEEYVKQFIKDLKERCPINCIGNHKFHLEIDKLAGAKLI